MRTVFLTILIVLYSQSAFSQTRNKPFAIYTTIGLKSAVGFCSIYNANMASDDNLEYNSGIDYSFGLKSSINYVGKKPINRIYGIHVNYMFDYFTLKCSKLENTLGAYSKTVKYKTSNLVITGRITNVEKKFFIELGPQFTHYRSIDVSNFGIHPNNAFYSSGFNYNNNYNDYASMVVGIGFYTKYCNVSLVQSFSLNSMTTSSGNAVKDGFYNHPYVNPDYEKNYKENNPTNIYSAVISLEYYIPFVKFKRFWRGKTKISVFEKVDPIYYWGKSLD